MMHYGFLSVYSYIFYLFENKKSYYIQKKSYYEIFWTAGYFDDIVYITQ